MLLLAAGPGLSVAAAAADEYQDPLCPEAVPSVTSFTRLTASDSPQQVLESATAVADAYDLCSKRKLADGNIEPGVHYAEVRQAQYLVVQGRALAALGKPADARSRFESARRSAQNVSDWVYNANGGNVGVVGAVNGRYSRFHDTAKSVADAAASELAKLSPPAK